ncbi:MAG: putative replication initiation protein [Microviridae sp.]|nr:MAG: putative replication initiation protein [Microviridae sp.]
MPCFYPVPAYRSLVRSPSGKYPLLFKQGPNSGDMVEVPCGGCIGCRIERSQAWAVRLMHEAQMHQENAFLTLTYSPEHLPRDNSLRKEHFQKFMKRYRKYIQPIKIRFFHCGEYGDENHRPHYHAIIFGHDFKDKVHHAKTKTGHWLYTSETLNNLWGFGYCYIGSVTPHSAGYVSRYIMKKITGERAKEHYRALDPETGEIHEIQPEYITMSRRPGIGQTWLNQFGDTDVFSEDFVPLPNGKTAKTPPYYLKQLEKNDLKRFKAIKRNRARKAKEYKASGEASFDRVQAKHQCAHARSLNLKREI